MNEQIMFDLVNRIADNDKVAPFQNGFVVLSNEEMVRYTELIVRECAEFCENKNSKLLGTMMKEHFGVEEK